ncbi:MAG: HlyC/CorC family transporter [Spirochaetales bacterium]|nr:HlyC/CorC family transporter [Spirochaetales bacterium]
MALSIILLSVCILLSGFFSASETAFTSLSAIQIQKLTSTHKRRGKQVSYLTSRPEILLTTILLGNNLVNIAASAIATQMTIEFFGSTYIGVTTGVLTFVILVFAEVNPKQLAIIHNEKIALGTAWIIHYLSLLFRPLIWLISLFLKIMGKLYGGKKRKKISLEGIFHMFSLAENEGVVEDYETHMVRNVFRFNDVQVHAIMTHRTEVFSLKKSLRIIDVLPKIIEKGYSRIPVYARNPEQIVGVVLTRDIMKCVTGNTLTRPLSSIMVDPIFVSETKKINDLFVMFQKEKMNMAIVLDEYGGLAGIVTIEDAIEEILGEIHDEYDHQEHEKVVQLNESSFRMQGDTSIEQVQDILGIGLEHEKHIQTLGGYLTELLGRFPHKKEIISTDTAEFIIEETKKHRIIQVLCSLKAE